MIHLKHLLAHPDLYKQECAKRYLDPVIIDNVLTVVEKRNKEIASLENLRSVKKQQAKRFLTLTQKEKEENINVSLALDVSIDVVEKEVTSLEKALHRLLPHVPNLSSDLTPTGRDAKTNVETTRYGTEPPFSFTPKPYYELPSFVECYQATKGVEASGFRGYYITGQLALLQQTLFQWTLNRLTKKEFEFIIPPVFVKEEVLEGTGFFPLHKEDVYRVDTDYYLPGTSEASLMFLHSKEVLDLTNPKKLMAWTRCFRKEAGAYGKDTKGGIRVTQFEKIETVILCKPEDSETYFQEIKNTFLETMNLLGVFVREMEVCSGDMSLKNHRQVDIEAYFPAQKEFRELCSASNCTDYQTRQLNIKTKNKEIAHSLNATGMVNRVMFAMMEQNQKEDGRVKIPEVLVPMIGEYL